MKKLFLGIFILIFATAVFAGGSIFKSKRKERNNHGYTLSRDSSEDDYQATRICRRPVYVFKVRDHL